ncbi:TPA: hypothetical protein RNX49_001613 [Pasteurella multocida]|nr:hypothetical protein [Pasteurella multocida]HDX1111067.1 hypothetical protein [Pasteurella multocida]HDX1186402.1 hypothetical protein [Pasteurella multocida]
MNLAYKLLIFRFR